MRIQIGDSDDGHLEGAYCPQCNREEDGDGGIIDTEIIDAEHYHYYCNAGCGFEVIIEIQHTIEKIITNDDIEVETFETF
jgi:hypothetical protein|tara:strand:+ start:617 stop:856 length:240 start_codon:yes stop_codon:yes gene_type:complete